MGDKDKPLCLVDVDGVLNAFRPVRPHRTVRANGYAVRIDDEARAMVDELKRHFEVVFHTLWNEAAARHIGPYVGLERAGFWRADWAAGYDAAEDAGLSHAGIRRLMYAKTPLLPRHMAAEPPGRRAVWIDDDVTGFDAEFLRAAGVDVRPVRTDADAGLSWDDVATALLEASAA